MRFVSGYYEDTGPFMDSRLFTEATTTQNPVDLRKGDVLCIWGGADIHPSYYGKTHSPRSQAERHPSVRDRIEWALMQRAKELNIPIIGICRGAQMLCALAGGWLIQHIENHGGHHIVATNDGRRYQTNSCHHQMMVPGNTNHTVVAQIPQDALRSTVYWDQDKMVDHKAEPEFILFHDVKGFAIQWHPEWMSHNSEATLHIFEQLENVLAPVTA